MPTMPSLSQGRWRFHSFRSTAPQRAPGSVTGCGLPFGLDICGSGLRGVVLVMVYLRWRPGSLLRWTLRRFFLGLVVINLHVMVADVSKSCDTVDRSILDCALERLGLPDWFRWGLFVFS